MKSLISLALTLFAVILLSSCNSGVHEHIVGEWEFSDNEHWRVSVCSLEKCDIEPYVEPHSDLNGDKICDVCTYEGMTDVQQKRLTLDKVLELSKKGSALTWSDFEEYQGVDIGSGLYIMQYDIDDTFAVFLGGGSMEDVPMYIRLGVKDKTDALIEIRDGNVEKFLEDHGIKVVKGNLKSYFELSDGTWQYEGHNYLYRLEITGRVGAADKDTTYVYLSNFAEISFQKAMMASGLSSNTEDYFNIAEAVLVELK